MACLGRDIIGIAKTGSGKTLAFLLPAFSQQLSRLLPDPGGGGPCMLILAPTRELACQIEKEAKKFGEPIGIRSATLYGGAPKGPQLAELRRRPAVVVATPGRLNDFLEPPPGLSQALDVGAVETLVLDEADRMLDMGFEPQIRQVISRLPHQRQTMMFTATWPFEVRQLAMDFMKNPIEVRVGQCDVLQANPDIEQDVIFCADMMEKMDVLLDLVAAHSSKATIVFVNTKRTCDILASELAGSAVIHGDRSQDERHAALDAFRRGVAKTLVATDVAARGLDIRGVQLVVNFDNPPREEDYVHRIGRTGRAGHKGLAISLLTNDDGGPARNISQVMERSGQAVPASLRAKLASGSMRFPAERQGRDRERDRERERQRRRARSAPSRPPLGARVRFGGVDELRFAVDM